MSTSRKHPLRRCSADSCVRRQRIESCSIPEQLYNGAAAAGPRSMGHGDECCRNNIVLEERNPFKNEKVNCSEREWGLPKLHSARGVSQNSTRSGLCLDAGLRLPHHSCVLCSGTGVCFISKKAVVGFAHRLAAMVSILLGRTDQYRTAWNQSAHKQNQAAVDRLSPVPARPSRAQHS